MPLRTQAAIGCTPLTFPRRSRPAATPRLATSARSLRVSAQRNAFYDANQEACCGAPLVARGVVSLSRQQGVHPCPPPIADHRSPQHERAGGAGWRSARRACSVRWRSRSAGCLGAWQWDRAHQQASAIEPDPPAPIADVMRPAQPGRGEGRLVQVDGAWADAPAALVAGKQVDGVDAVLLVMPLAVPAAATGIDQPATLPVLMGWLPAASDCPRHRPELRPSVAGYVRGGRGYVAAPDRDARRLRDLAGIHGDIGARPRVARSRVFLPGGVGSPAPGWNRHAAARGPQPPRPPLPDLLRRSGGCSALLARPSRCAGYATMDAYPKPTRRPSDHRHPPSAER